MRPLKEKVRITLDNNVVSKLRELSEQDERSLSQYINIILKEYIKKLEENN